MTNRIFKDNPTTGKANLIKKLENLLQAEVLLIPAHNTDETGHADGHIRFINDKTVLVNELAREFVYWKKGFMQMINDSGLHYLEMPWFEKNSKASPCQPLASM